MPAWSICDDIPFTQVSAEIYTYFRSKFFSEIPLVQVSSELYTYTYSSNWSSLFLKTGGAKVKSGDVFTLEDLDQKITQDLDRKLTLVDVEQRCAMENQRQVVRDRLRAASLKSRENS